MGVSTETREDCEPIYYIIDDSRGKYNRIDNIYPAQTQTYIIKDKTSARVCVS